MKTSNVLLALFALLVFGCKYILAPEEKSSDLTLTVDKENYSANDTILVSLRNNSDEPVFLGGCSPIFIASQTDTGWSAAPLVVCVWEGFAQKVEVGKSFQQRIPARYFPGVHKFEASVYVGCADNEPVSNARCRWLGAVSSKEFHVGGAGNLEIVTERQQYSWHADDLGASRLVRATLVNKSDQTFYAILGDAMIGSLDQEDLHVAYGSHGRLEQLQTADSWRALPSGILIEGVRFIALRPRQSYRLLTHLHALQGNETGTFRIRVEYFDQIDPPEDTAPRLDYSNVFTISN